MSTAVTSPRPPGSAGGSRNPRRPAPPVTSTRLGALSVTEDKQQTAKNTAVSAKALELAESICSIHDSTMINVRAKLAQLASRLDENRTSALDNEEHYVWAQPCEWDFQRLVERFDYELTVPQLAALSALGEYSATPVRLALQELSSTKLAKRGVNTKREEMRPTDVHSDQPLSDQAILLYEFLHADVLGHAKEELSRTDAGVNRVLQTIDYHKAARDEAVKETNTADAERHHREMLDAYIELLNILDTRLAQLALSTNDTMSFRGQAQQAIDEAREMFEDYSRKSKELQDAVNRDVQRAQDVRRDEEKKHKDASHAHRLYHKSLMDYLDDNAKQQQDAFDEIVNLVQLMRDLSDERLKRLQQATAEKQKEELRIANFNEFSQVQADHLRYLEKIKDQADGYCFAAGGLTEYLAEMEKKIQDKDVESQLKELTLDEARRYLVHYRGYVLSSGELSTKKELRNETLGRQRRLLQLQKETALASLDPDLYQYTQRQEEIDGKIDTLAREVAKLRDEMDASAANWTVAEDLLVSNGVAFEHPHAERGEAAAAEKERYVSRTLEFVTKEETAVERHRDQLRKIKTIAENEKRQKRAAREDQSAPSSPQQGPPPAAEEEQSKQQQQPTASSSDAPAAASADSAPAAVDTADAPSSSSSPDAKKPAASSTTTAAAVNSGDEPAAGSAAPDDPNSEPPAKAAEKAAAGDGENKAADAAPAADAAAA